VAPVVAAVTETQAVNPAAAEYPDKATTEERSPQVNTVVEAVAAALAELVVLEKCPIHMEVLAELVVNPTSLVNFIRAAAAVTAAQATEASAAQAVLAVEVKAGTDHHLHPEEQELVAEVVMVKTAALALSFFLSRPHFTQATLLAVLLSRISVTERFFSSLNLAPTRLKRGKLNGIRPGSGSRSNWFK
jgi:hypothetical protein